ncbi:MAG: fused response regulator/phosphatase [Calditrichaeota bacterium]|nr:MAG: fused response regulator/phosphatase [Calditrichota bacterium]
MKVLIVEDDRNSMRLLQHYLEKWGHQVVCATNGVEAVNRLQQENFPLIITDWIMPEMDGLELVRWVRHHGQKEYTYIIMLTSRTEKEAVVEGMEAGADDFLAKPFNSEELRARIRAGERVVRLERTLMEQNQALQLANERMKRDLEYAALIQKSLLPEHLPPLPSVTVAYRFLPCEELAGDILDVFQLEPDLLGMYVLDVSGHGVAAALLSVTLHRLLSPVLDQLSLVRRRVGEDGEIQTVSPAEVVAQLNRRFQIEESHEQYFSMIYGLLHIKEGAFTYVSAGHPGMVHLSSRGTCRLIKSPALPIGFFPDTQYEEKTLSLAPGDRLYLYSDGVVETRNNRQEQFGTSRLMQVVGRAASQPLSRSLDLLIEELARWRNNTPLEDDVSILAVEFAPQS